ncbi:MAG: type IV secretion system DNA-binding domain-containing protein [Cyanobacteriota bacterium]|nr:type IV secretion system DNA-binding domain-containing protein [Cyanobacteriota bacterium]
MSDTTSQHIENAPFQNAINFIQSENGLMLIGLMLAFIALNIIGNGQGKNKLARSFWGGNSERKKAKKTALKQIQEKKKNKVSLYIGKTQSLAQIYLTSAERGTAVIGGPGSGKTASCLNPLLMSAIAQSFPIIMYDFKYPQQTSEIIGIAAKSGYKIKIFAPGFPESEVCNPLDFLKDETDATMARELATVMNRNLSLASNATEDKFFSEAGDQLVTALLMLTKSLETPDLMTIQALLSLEQLPQRISAASDQLNPWVILSFAQLFQVASSEKTVAGIIATASKLFSRFLAPELISCFTGQTSIPLKLEGKQLLVFGLNRERREASSPLIAALIHLIVTKNVASPRKDPLILCLDEIPTLYLPDLVRWPNENRSDGLVTMIGLQNIGQLEKAYGSDASRSILGGLATKFFFNPQDSNSAKFYSEYLGEETISIKSKSRTSGKGGVSNNLSDHLHKIHLVEPAEFNRFPPGKCVLINPGYSRQKEGSIPINVNLRLVGADLSEWSMSVWPKIKDKLRGNSQQLWVDDKTRKEQVKQRLDYVKNLFPLPDKIPSESTQVKAKLDELTKKF